MAGRDAAEAARPRVAYVDGTGGALRAAPAPRRCRRRTVPRHRALHLRPPDRVVAVVAPTVRHADRDQPVVARRQPEAPSAVSSTPCPRRRRSSPRRSARAAAAHRPGPARRRRSPCAPRRPPRPPPSNGGSPWRRLPSPPGRRSPRRPGGRCVESSCRAARSCSLDLGQQVVARGLDVRGPCRRRPAACRRAFDRAAPARCRRWRRRRRAHRGTGSMDRPMLSAGVDDHDVGLLAGVSEPVRSSSPAT